MLAPPTSSDEIRRSLCTHLGHSVSQTAVRISHSKWQHMQSIPPPVTPDLPFGSLWGLVNHIKVMHQYTDLLSEAASGRGVHAPLLTGSKEMCVGNLEWFLPLCRDLVTEGFEDYRRHVDIWRETNPGDYGPAESVFHAHQAYAVEDRNMTRYLVSLLKPHAKEYEAEIAANMLRARPDSFDDFERQFSDWRSEVLYHPLCLAARNMPRAEQWVPEAYIHEAGDWQDLLDIINRGSFVSKHRLTAVCEALADRSPMLNNLICDVLDKVATLTRVKSNAAYDSKSLDDYMPQLQFPKDERSPYTHCLMTWVRLRQTLEQCVPPSLLCPALCPPSRGAWGYRRLLLAMHDETLQIQPSPFAWMDKDTLGQKENITTPQDRLYDILVRLGEAATSPEVAHLMLDPKSLHRILAGGERGALPDYSNRQYVIDQMRGRPPSNADFIACLNKIIQSLPANTERGLGAPVQLLAWRIDSPPRAILYHGAEGRVDLATQPPYTLEKTILQDKLINRTVSGISILNEPALDGEGIHAALRSCVAEEIVGAHPDFANHPHHQVTVKIGPGKTETRHTTTLAEAVSLFTGPPPQQLSDVALHESAPWSEGHIDARYAERQTGDNGSRFRDWAVVYQDEEEIQRARLAAHEVRCSKVYETHFPLSNTGAGHTWVSVASTVPTETRVLRHLGGRTGLEVLKRAVENRFKHDTKLLPKRHSSDTIDAASTEIYTDEKSGHVLLAYAPVAADGGKQIEFMSFRHC